jgi:hypothetical protein
MSKKSEKFFLLKNEKKNLGEIFWLQFEIYVKFLIPITHRLILTYVLGDERPVDQTNIF